MTGELNEKELRIATSAYMKRNDAQCSFKEKCWAVKI